MKIDELIALLESGSERGNEYDDDLMHKAAETIRILNAVPAADVRPVVHAHWEIANRTYENSSFAPWICSECKKHGGNYRWYGSKPTWIRFCETCGAVMDEEAQDGD